MNTSRVDAAIVVPIAWFTIARLAPMVVAIADVVIGRTVADRG